MGNNKITFHRGHTINNGRTLSPEHKEKIRQGLRNAKAAGVAIGHPKGKPSWNKGVSVDTSHLRTADVRKKLAVAQRGRVCSDATRKRLSEINRGKRASPRTEFQPGMISPRKGATLSPETRRKISENRRGKYLSAESVRRALSRRTPSSLELKMQSIIDRNHLPYRFVGDGSFLIGRKNPDFVNINGDKVVIEVYARYYKLRNTKSLDEWKEERRKVFGDYGWSVVFFDETQVKDNDVVTALARRDVQ